MADLTPAELAEIEQLRQRGTVPAAPPRPEDTSSPNAVIQFLQRFNPPPGLVGGTLGGIAGAGLGSMAGGVGAAPGGIIGAGLGAAGEENLRQMLSGRFDPARVGMEGLVGGASQAGGEAALAPFRYVLNALRLKKATQAATAAYETAKSTRAGEVARDEAIATAKTAADKAAYATNVVATKTANQAAVQAHKAEVAAIEATQVETLRNWQAKGATTVAEAWKTAVPSWRQYPSETQGLLEMVYGKGQADLSHMFDTALKEVVTAGRGRLITLPTDAATTLGVTSQGVVESVSGKGTFTAVDAGEAAKAVVGFWKKDQAVYRTVARALDQAGLGNQAAREEYMTGQAVIDFVSRNKVLEGGTYHADRVLSGLTTGLKSLNALRNRGMGDVFRGPFAESVQGMPLAPALPPAPTPRPMPVRPQPTLPPERPEIGPPPAVPAGYQTRQLPRVSPWVGGMAAEIPTLMQGASGGFGEMGPRSALPFALGTAATALLSGRQIVTRAGRDPAIEALLHAFPTLAAQYAGAQYFGEAK